MPPWGLSCWNVHASCLPGVLEIVSCLNSMCEEEEHDPLTFKIMATTKWSWKMSVLKNKSMAYLVSESKGCLNFGNYCLLAVGPSRYSLYFAETFRHSAHPLFFFCQSLAFNVAAINHNKIFEALHLSLQNPTKREWYWNSGAPCQPWNLRASHECCMER